MPAEILQRVSKILLRFVQNTIVTKGLILSRLINFLDLTLFKKVAILFFVSLQINERLKKIRSVKPKAKIQRSQSAPNVNLNQDSSSLPFNHGFYDEDGYPNSPCIFFDDHKLSPPLLSPNYQEPMNESTSDIITNL